MTPELLAEWLRIVELSRIDYPLAMKLAASWGVSLAERDLTLWSPGARRVLEVVK